MLKGVFFTHFCGTVWTNFPFTYVDHYELVEKNLVIAELLILFEEPK